MADDTARSRGPAEPRGRLCAEAATLCAQIEEAIDTGQAEAAILALFEGVRQPCEILARGRSEAADLARHMNTAVATWRGVWPRLGRQAEFRMAVAREARSRTKQFAALAKATESP